MTVKEDEECHIDFDHDDDDVTPIEVLYALSSLQCEEGLVCVPKVRGLKKGVCKKPNTTIADNISCVTDLGCPLDSICRCNDLTGDVQCVPLPASSATFLKKYESTFDTIVECKKKYKGDIEYEEKLAKCCLDDVNNLVEHVGKKVYPYSSELRCLDYSLLGAASAVKVSALAMAFSFILFLFF